MWSWYDFWRGTAVGTCGLILCIIIEHVAPVERYTLRQRLAGLTMQYFGGWFGLAMVWPVQHFWEGLGFKPYLIPLWSLLSPLKWWGYAIEVVIVLIVWDFVRYWRHRAEHKWFWPIHAVHHSPNELHAANSLGHPLQGLIELALVTIPMSLIQFSGPTEFPIVSAISSMLTLYIHSPTTAHLGPAWRVIVDPRFHRIHHSLEPRHFDRNFAVCFSFWDSLFGTAYWPKKGEWPAVGVKEYPAPRNFWEYLMLPLGPKEPANARVRRVFPSVTAFTRDWQPGKWLALPAILLFNWLLLVAIVAEFIDGWPGP